MKRNSSFKVVSIFNSTVLWAVGASLCLIGSTNLVAADCAPPASGLVSWWPGESSAVDIIGGNNGTLSSSGASYAAGLVGQAFRFDGSNGYVSIPDAPSLKPTNITVEAWVQFDSDVSPNANIPGQQYIVFKKNSRSTSFEGYTIMRNRISGKDCFTFSITSAGGTQQYAASTTVPTIGVWYHIAGTYDHGTGYLKIYVNGVLEGSTYAGFNLDYGTRPIFMGTTGEFWDGKLQGKIDEPSIYSRALTQTEIAAIYAAGSAGKCFQPTVPEIVSEPASQTVEASDPATFSVSATGTPSLQYQWFFGGTAIYGATNSILTLPSVQLSQAGGYSVRVTNLYGVAWSSTAQLIVTPPTCFAPPSGMAAWWAGDGNTLDSVSTNHGSFSDGVSFVAGKVGSAFNLLGSSRVVVKDNAVLDPTNALTIEFWMNRQGIVGSFDPLVKKSDPSQTKGYSIEFNGSYLYFYVFNGSWRWAGGVPISFGQWCHIAGVFDCSKSNLVLYVNGNKAGAITTISAPIVPSTNYLAIGNDPGNPTSRFFKGFIDEITIYNRALSANEIKAIYHAGSLGKCPLPPSVVSVTPTNWYVNEGSTVSYVATATGSPTLAYQWQHNGLVIPGEANATLTLSNVVYAQAGNYTVVVSNLAGLASSNVTLRVNRAPIADASASASLLISPNDTNAMAVLDGSRSSDPDGDALNYAWFISGEAAPFATGVVTMKSLPVGTNHLILTVNDSMASGSQNFVVEVITASQAVDRLSQLVKTNSSNSMALIASLRAALLAIDRSHPAVAIQMLEVFINKVHVQLEPVDPALAAEFIAEAQAIIDALNGDGNVTLKAIELLPITSGANGKSHLKIKGNANRTYVIETSTNMVDWVPAGVATRAEDGTYEFDDTQAQGAGVRFYRVVSPQ